MSLVTRFAPSPTGRLHLGHAYAAWVAWSRARAAGGRFLLRLEDIDPRRCRPAFAEAIDTDLAWLGLQWDGAVRVQSAHLGQYQAVLTEWRGRGLLYPCFCSRAEIAASAAAPHGPDGGPLYPGTCRHLAYSEWSERMERGDPHAWRLNMGRALAGCPPLEFFELGVGRVRCEPEKFGDVVLARRDAPASYHLCVTHDDAAQGVTLVTRGEDLRPATHLHRLLQFLGGWPTPDYAHHKLLTSGGARLSKRDGATTLAALRDAGHPPLDVLRLAGCADPLATPPA